MRSILYLLFLSILNNGFSQSIKHPKQIEKKFVGYYSIAWTNNNVDVNEAFLTSQFKAGLLLDINMNRISLRPSLTPGVMLNRPNASLNFTDPNFLVEKAPFIISMNDSHRELHFFLETSMQIEYNLTSTFSPRIGTALRYFLPKNSRAGGDYLSGSADIGLLVGSKIRITDKTFIDVDYYRGFIEDDVVYNGNTNKTSTVRNSFIQIGVELPILKEK